MGIAGIGVWQLVIIFAIAMLLFGSGRLRNLGGDLGAAIRGFRDATRGESAAAVEMSPKNAEPHSGSSV